MVDLRDVLHKKENELTVLQQEIEAIRTVLRILEKEAAAPRAAEAEPPRVISKPTGYSSVNVETGTAPSGMANSSAKPWTSILQARNS
jgi:hypothetical protein